MQTPKKSERVAAFMADLGIEAPASTDPRYLGFFHCFNRGDYYEAHDVLENLWLETIGADREFYKGLIQVAGCFVHLRKQFEQPDHHHHGRRLIPAARLFRIAINRLDAFAPQHLGVDVEAVLRLCRQHLGDIEKSQFGVNPWSPACLPEIRLHSPRLPITVLTGFLGSGKTTLLRRWRRDEALRGAAIIVHDLSDFGLDAELLTDEGASTEAGHLNDRTAALHGIHAREQLHATLARVLGEIAVLDPTPPQILAESTGAARPWPLITALTQNSRFFLRHFIVTVDALNLHRDFEDGRVLAGEAPAPADPALRQAAEILAEQIAFASIIILTKTDIVPKATADAQVRTLQKLQPHAAIALSAQAGLKLNQLDAVPAPRLTALETTANRLGLDAQAATTAEDVDCLILRDPRPFHPGRLYDACQHHLGTGLYRTKGYLWLASRPGHCLLWQQSGSQIVLELTGLWRAEIVHNRDGKLLPEEISQLKAQLSEKHPHFGDRHNELTLIGLRPAREAFAAALRAALCTDDEIAAWQRGESFPDPWPENLRVLG